MRARWLLPLIIVLAGLPAVAVPPAGAATITSVFSGTATPISCTVQTGTTTTGQRWCSGSPSRVNSFDGTIIDTSVTLPPAPASGADGNFPVIGVFHGWGGSKFVPSATETQRFVTQGYAVFSITDRGWGSSCGGSSATPKTGSCAYGYIHLMHRAYEVRDVQYLLGLLADEGVIDPQRIGSTGGSYGGGMSLQLAALKNRTQLADGSLVPWTSPGGLPMRLAAALPLFGWTDLAQSLQPNGSILDYAAYSPYQGPLGDRRFGTMKNQLTQGLYTYATASGYLAPTSGTGFPDTSANITAWNNFNLTGGPYDNQPLALEQINELPNHSAYYLDDSVAPAPMLIANGWNDDLFPVDEAVNYYNKVRADHPETPIAMFHLDFGHQRAPSTFPDVDSNRLYAAGDPWFAYFVKGVGPAPVDRFGGVDVITSVCPVGTGGVQYHAPSWASLAKGEVRLQRAASQVVQAPGNAPTVPFTSGTVCDTQNATTNASAATYSFAPAPSGGYTLMGAPTVIADLTVNSPNDQLIARLYDTDPTAGTSRLIARGIYRPTGIGAGPTRQVFQMHPQAYKIEAGHVVTLELLARDTPYALTTGSAMPQQNITVANLDLRLPTLDVPGTGGGFVTAPAARMLPSGYEWARDLDVTAPTVRVSDATVEAAGPTGSIVNYTASANDDRDGAVAASCTPASGARFAIGTTTVTCTATDAFYNVGTATFRVIVRDTTAPVLVVPGSVTREATGPSGAAVTYSVSASDLVDGAVTPSCSKASGAVFAVTTTTVSCTATDARGNATSASFPVTVRDTTAPVLTLPTSIAASGPGYAYVDYGATASDLVDGSVPVVCSPPSGSAIPLGTTTATCTATDAHGNHSGGSVVVTVTYAPGAPDAPAGVSAAGAPHGATVSWSAPNANGSAITSYTVVASPDGASVTVPGDARSATLGGLRPGTAYTFRVRATNGIGAGPLSAASNSVSVTPVISVGATTGFEGDAGTRTISFPVTLSQPATTTVSATYTISAIGATGGSKPGAGVDLKVATGTIKFIPSASTGRTGVIKKVTVTVYGDTVPENAEAFDVRLSSPTGGYTVDSASGQEAAGEILDDDTGAALPVVGIGDATLIEGDTGTGRALYFPVSISRPPTASVSISYTVVPVSATYSLKALASADFGGNTGGTITFGTTTSLSAVSKTITVPIYANSSTEGAETFMVVLSGGAGQVSIVRAVGTGTILDDD